MIGAPPGYIGYDEAGQLTEAVRRRPYSVVLFDEIEKAHTDVLNILLQLLDDGRLTDSKGRTVDFKNVVVIMTSNIGSQFIAEHSDELSEGVRRQVTEALRQHFRPEFINRIDEVVVFHPLGEGQIRGIAEIQLERLRGRLGERDLRMEVTDAAMAQLCAAGYDPVYGARPLKRAIQTAVENPLAQKLLAGDFVPGDTILVEEEHGVLVFHKKLYH
jgi:ATP-dependent Clp protease ATP-binding subunit ClpB